MIKKLRNRSKKSQKWKAKFQIVKPKKLCKVIVNCTFNNTIINAQLNENKNIIINAGLVGFKGAKRSSIYAAQQIVNFISHKLLNLKFTNIILIFNNFSKVRKSIIKTFKKKKLNIIKIIDITSIPHNGCRLVKKRRL